MQQSHNKYNLFDIHNILSRGSGSGGPGKQAEQKSVLDELKEDEALIMIGYEDEASNRTCIIQVTNTKLFITKKESDEKPLLNYEFDLKTQEIIQNGNPVVDASGIFAFKRMLREFQDRNKDIRVFKIRDRGVKQ
ncbi:MAG: hypothetical protein ABIH39_05060 [Candidatus Margulisiibacteriota bacterium]